MNRIPERHRKILLRCASFVTLSGIAVIAVAATWEPGLPNAAPAQVGDRGIVKPPLKDEVDEFMKKKLAALNDVMGGVARDDFDKVRKEGEELVRLSREAVWNQRANAGYVQDTADFVDSVQFLLRMADDKDAEGVTLGYTKVVLSCSNCHRHVRGPKIASLEPQDVLIGAVHSPVPSLR